MSPASIYMWIQQSQGVAAFPLGLILGALVLGPVVLLGLEGPSPYFAMPAWALFTLGLSLPGPRSTGPVWAAAGVGLSFPGFVVLRIIVDGLFDPTSHNLLPFEILLAFVYPAPSAVVGMIGGWFMDHTEPDIKTATTLVAIGLALCVAAMVFRIVELLAG